VWFQVKGCCFHLSEVISAYMCADMEKFPVRMKDNDLLVTQLFEDPLKEPITALSVYYTPISCKYHLASQPAGWSVREFPLLSHAVCVDCSSWFRAELDGGGLWH